jgi:endonuclease/exonuclease/phosphatase (EEP) superfamily protein YafD
VKPLLGLLCAVLCAATVLGFASDWAWGLDLLSHFRAQYLVLLILLAIVLLLRRHWVLAVASVCAAAVNLIALAPYLPGLAAAPASLPASDANTLKLMALNLNSANSQRSRVVDLLGKESPDLVVLTELTPIWDETLRPLFEHGLAVPRPDGFGIAIYSRVPLAGPEIVRLGGLEAPSVLATVLTPAGSFRIMGVHLYAPTGPIHLRRRDTQLVALAERVAEVGDQAVLVLGDLNITPWSRAFTRMLDDSGLMDGSIGRGLQATWPSVFPPLLIPIDHVLLKGPIVLRSERVGPYVGSDHYPLIAEIRLMSRP